MPDREASRERTMSPRIIRPISSGGRPLAEDREEVLDKEALCAGLENFRRYLEILREWDRQERAEMSDEVE